MELFSQKMQRTYLLSMIALIAFLSVCGYYKKQRLERQARKAASVRTMMLDIQNKSVDTEKAIVEIPQTQQTTIDKRSTTS